MSDGDALLAAIREHPDEDTPRLAFADWLDERGEADRAEFVRAQCALSHLPDEDDRRTGFEVRERQLLARHAADWARPRPVFPGFLASDGSREEAKGYWSAFRRGFLEGVGWHELRPEHMEAGSEVEQLFAAHPVRELRLQYFTPGSLLALAGRPEVARLESLELTYFGNRNDADDLHEARVEEVETFLRSARLDRLRALSLTLFPTRVGPEASLLRLPVFSRLRKLEVWSRDGGRDEFWTSLAGGACPQLAELEVQWGYDRESPEVGRLFANSDAGKRLRRLRVSTSDTGSPFPWAEVLANAPLEELEVTAGSGTNAPELLEALARTAASGRLRTLRIFGINTPAVGVAGWLKTGYAAGVRELALESTHLSDSALRGLAESPELARLTRLTVNGYGTTTPEGLQALFESPHLTGLRHLDASTAGLTAANVLRLAERGSCRGLRVVNLGQLTEYRGGVPVKSAGEPAALSLGRGKPFPHLHTVKTWGVDEELNPEAFRELLESPNLFNLVALRLGVRDSKLADWRKFAAGTGLAWIGGGVSNGNWVTGSVALHPENVYLPNHLDDFGH